MLTLSCSCLVPAPKPLPSPPPSSSTLGMTMSLGMTSVLHVLVCYHFPLSRFRAQGSEEVTELILVKQQRLGWTLCGCILAAMIVAVVLWFALSTISQANVCQGFGAIFSIIHLSHIVCPLHRCGNFRAKSQITGQDRPGWHSQDLRPFFVSRACFPRPQILLSPSKSPLLRGRCQPCSVVRTGQSCAHSQE